MSNKNTINELDKKVNDNEDKIMRLEKDILKLKKGNKTLIFTGIIGILALYFVITFKLIRLDNIILDFNSLFTKIIPTNLFFSVCTIPFFILGTILYRDNLKNIKRNIDKINNIRVEIGNIKNELTKLKLEEYHMKHPINDKKKIVNSVRSYDKHLELPVDEKYEVIDKPPVKIKKI